MNDRYTYANQQLLSGNINWLTQTFKAVLVNIANYVFQKDVHQHLSDIPASARIATSLALTSPTVTNGVALADDVLITSVTGPVIGAIVIFKDTGDATTSDLICYLDTGIGLPRNPQGGDVAIHWDRGPNGIFKL